MLKDQTSKTGKSKKLTFKWKGPYTILETGIVNYTIKMDKPRARATVVNVNRLKKCFMNSLFPQDAPASDSEDAVVIRPGRKPRSKKQTNKSAAPVTTTSAAAQ